MNKLKIYEGYRRVIALFYPNKCPFCGRITEYDKYLCESCAEYLPYIRKRIDVSESISRFYACCFYTQRARDAVLSMKFAGEIYPVDAFGKMMSEMLEDELKTADMLVPVPSGFLSVKKRGFAPAEKIAGRISIHSGVPMIKAVGAYDKKLEQKLLSGKKRIENAEKSFYVCPKADVLQKRIILIDDVCTTGSTLGVIAEKLRAAGAADVCAAVFAKTAELSGRELPRAKFRVRTCSNKGCM